MKVYSLTASLLFAILISSPLSAQDRAFFQKNFRQHKGSPDASAFYGAWVDSGETADAYQEDLGLIPASSFKVVTAYCTLKELGVGARFATRFLSEAPITGGKIGNLWVEGEGDPVLVIERLWLVVQELKKMGLREITGDLVLDNSYFDSFDYPGRLENSHRAYNAPTSALAVNFNSVNLGTPEEPVYRSIEDPTRNFGSTFSQLLKDNGITFHGKIREGKASNQIVLFEAKSKRLGFIVNDMNKFSNNFIAEQLVKVLGAKHFGAPGSTQKGTAALTACLQAIGIDEKNFHIENGSGLSYKNKISAKDLVKVLLAGYHDFSIQPEFVASLSVNGVDGTMEKRKSPAELEKTFRGKTGSLNGVSSVAGFVPSADGRLLAFTILMNEFRGGPQDAHQIQDMLILKITGRK